MTVVSKNSFMTYRIGWNHIVTYRLGWNHIVERLAALGTAAVQAIGAM